MELIKVCLTGLLMVSLIAGQEEGTEGLLSGLIKVIKTEVSNQMKIERKTLKEEILIEIRDDREIRDMFVIRTMPKIIIYSKLYNVSSNL